MFAAPAKPYERGHFRFQAPRRLARSVGLATLQDDKGQQPASGEGFLSGNFAPVDREIFARDMPVEGTMPAAVNGVYIRNGPNPRFPPDSPEKHHWCAHRVLFVVSCSFCLRDHTHRPESRAARQLRLLDARHQLVCLERLCSGSVASAGANSAAGAFKTFRESALASGGVPVQLETA